LVIDSKGKGKVDGTERDKTPINDGTKDEKPIDLRNQEEAHQGHLLRERYFYLFDHYAQGRLLQEKDG
jgi:hypothetical protein